MEKVLMLPMRSFVRSRKAVLKTIHIWGQSGLNSEVVLPVILKQDIYMYNTGA